MFNFTDYIILLRIVHIFAGVFWVGSAWLVVGFLEPTATALGSDGGKFMNYLANARRFPYVVLGAAAFNLAAGILLYLARWGGPSLSTPWAIAVSIGAVAAITAFIIGGGLMAPTTTKLGRLGTEIARAGKPPTPEQLARLQQLQLTLRRAGIAVALLLTITLLAMATGRYL